jgi:hypothetical protein
MKWAKPRDEVAVLFSMLPNLKGLVNKNFSVTLENNALFAKIMFSSPSDATSFARAWSSSRPQQYKAVIAKYVPEN